MPITVIPEGQGKWIVRSAYADKDVVKAAGARWDRDRRTWWTDKPEVAAKLANGDAAAIALINAERAAAHERTVAAIEASRAADADIDIPAPAGLTYLPYQRAGIAYAQDRAATLIGDEMGLGKTIQAIGVINADPTIESVLIVCPASLKLNWAREARKWLVRHLGIGIANGACPDANVVIVNYEQLGKHRRAIDARVWDLLISDECHYVKNPKAQRTALLLGKWDKDPAKRVEPIKAKRRVFLSGTPMVNRPIELWPILRSLDPFGLGRNWRAYVTRYCDGHQTEYGWDVSGASNLEELQTKLRAKLMVRRLKRDVLTELPAKRRQVIPFQPDAEGRAAIERENRLLAGVEAARLALEASSDPAEYERAVAALQAAQEVAFTEMAAVRHDVAVAKIPQVIAHVTDMLENAEKIVLMAHHHDVIDALKAEFGAAAVVLTGETPLAQRQAAVDSFQADPAVRLFIGSIRAAGVGITLTAASTVLFAELDWTPGGMSQAEDRCHRIGQRESVLVQHLVLDGSFDQRMAETLIEKQAVLDAGLDHAVSIQAPAPIAPPAPVTPVAPSPDDLSPEQIAAVHEALKRLAGLCDGAYALDDRGFNKVDTEFGHKLARESQLSQKQARWGATLANKYRRQLPAELLAVIRGDA
jgi:SNF2-related domain/Helicase conserved C-terminal domain